MTNMFVINGIPRILALWNPFSEKHYQRTVIGMHVPNLNYGRLNLLDKARLTSMNAYLSVKVVQY